MEENSGKMNLATFAMALLHGSAWAFYSLMLSYAIPPISASAYAISGVLLLWIYVFLISVSFRRCFVFAAIVVFIDIVVAAESFDVYRETQRSLSQGRAMANLIIAVMLFVSEK